MMGERSVDYHRATVIERADDFATQSLDYYGSRGETPLVWGGSAVEGLGLGVGRAVTPGEYEALFAPGGAKDPASGVRLVGTRRPGMEVIVSAHKSVAELGVIHLGEVMHGLLDAERDATLAYLDEVTRARGGRRGRARTPVATGGLVYAHTRHATSRAGDPCPHDHVLVANLVQMHDGAGGWKAADTALWRDELHAATMVGRLASARRAVELGWGIEADPGPSGTLRHWRLKGIPAEVVALHSTRTAEIDAHVGSRGGGNSPRAGGWRRGRPARPSASSPRAASWPAGAGSCRRPAGRRRCCGSAWTPTASGRRRGRSPTPRWASWSTGPSAPTGSWPPPRCSTGPRSSWRWRRGCSAGPPRTSAGSSSGSSPTPRSSPWSAWPAPGTATTPWPRWWPSSRPSPPWSPTAPPAAATPPLPEATVARAVGRAQERLGHRLSRGQLEAVVGICRAGRAVSVVVGVAGSGKTTALAAVADAYGSCGYRVFGTATSGQAARTLGREAALVESRTVASLRWRLDHGRLCLDRRSVVIVDEAGMTDDGDLLAVLTQARAAGAKVVLVGDDRQLGPVGPGGALGALLTRLGGGAHVLDENLRQADAAERAALDGAPLRGGRPGRRLVRGQRPDPAVPRAGRGHRRHRGGLDGRHPGRSG